MARPVLWLRTRLGPYFRQSAESCRSAYPRPTNSGARRATWCRRSEFRPSSLSCRVEILPLAKSGGLTIGVAALIENRPHGRLVDHESPPALGNAHAAIVVDIALPSHLIEQARPFIAMHRLRRQARRCLDQLLPA